MKRFTYEVVIDIDEEVISDKYPNYKSDYNNPEELANSIIETILYSDDVCLNEYGMEQWGYSVNAESVPHHKYKLDRTKV